MSVTSGFFNSINGDRRYNAEQMSAIFDGIIRDGILASIGTAFTVTYVEGNSVEIGIGRAWFNSTWLYNDAILPMELDIPEVVLDRIDAIVIEIDHSNGVRAGNIKVVKGTPSGEPVRPVMTNTVYVHQYPLAYIYRKANAESFSQADITSMIGTSECPYVTGILQVQNIDNIVAQWHAQWIEWFVREQGITEAEADKIIYDWRQWYDHETTSSEEEFSKWMSQMQADFEKWLESLHIILGDDTATLLGTEIAELKEKFETLAKDRCIYQEIQDSNGDPILDSNGLAIEGSVSFYPVNSGSEKDYVTLRTFENHIDDFKNLSADLDDLENTVTANKNDADQKNKDVNSRLDALNAKIDSKNSITVTIGPEVPSNLTGKDDDIHLKTFS